MKTHPVNPRKALNKAFLKVKPNRSQIENFKSNLIKLIDTINENESEEFHKNLVSAFLNDTYYKNNHFINTKGRNDLVIHNGKDAKSNVGVIIEAKKPANKAEMLQKDKINTKAFQELLLYFLRERITFKNKEIKHLVATNIYEWFIFDAETFEKEFAQNKALVKEFTDFEEGRLSGKTTDFFYKDIAGPAINKVKNEISFTHFDIRDYENTLRNQEKKDDDKLIALFKLLSPEHLLILPFANDSNTLDKTFYAELLHIIGLSEKKEGSKKLIGRKPEKGRDNGSFIENTMSILKYEDCLRDIDRSAYGKTQDEQLFNVALELSITWINRILFLKLLEGQLIKYHKGDTSYKFLNTERISDYDALNKLFFQVLAVKESERSEIVKKKFAKIPYLNSSLFEPNLLEHKTIRISNLEDEYAIPLLSATVLKDNTGKRLNGEMNTLEYLLRFLDAFDFASEGSEEIQEDNKALINASVLGLIFEKINGYKDGSFFTPGFITMYMAKETIRRAVVQKFNDAKGWSCKAFEELYDKIGDKKEANEIINSLKICDPAVGSGHFLVSALNEIIAIKSELKILLDREGKTLRDYTFEVINDELIITDDNGSFFEYHPKSKESQRVQETIFHEKQTIIENCLFGVDINPNSVKICRLRLWIELLKNAYYKKGTEELETLPNIDINIKPGNSLVSRFELDADLKKALRKSKWNIESYRLAVSTYRNAGDKEEKAAMQKLIDDIKNDFETNIDTPFKKKISKARGELDNIVSEINVKKQWGEKLSKEFKAKLDKATKKLSKLEEQREDIKNNKIYENAFEWRFEFPEVLNDDGEYLGFDVIIGNPPWGANLSKQELEHIKKWNQDIIVRMIDTFMFFINISFFIKSKYGLVCQIIPDVILYQIDSVKIRQKILADYQLLIIANLGDNIFKDVARPSCIIQFGNKTYETKTKVFEYKIKENIDINNIKPTPVATSFFKNLPNSVFATRNLKGYTLLNRLNQSALSELIDEDGIQRGVSPDLKEAFIVDEKTINDYSLEQDFIFPTATGGRDIKRYLARDIGKRIIYTKKTDSENNISNIIKYISTYKNRITCSEVKQNKHPFWALHRSRKRSIFEKSEKILGVITGDRISVSIDSNKLYPTDGIFVFSSNGIYSNYFLVGLLNSKLFSYLYRLISLEKSRTLAQIKPSILKSIPISKEFDKKIVKQIDSKTKKIVDKIEIKDPIIVIENEIDQLVYQLYGLTEEEIRIVEESVG